MWIDILVKDWLMHGGAGFLVAFSVALLIGIISGSGYWKQTRLSTYTRQDVPFILGTFFYYTLLLFLLGLLHLRLDGVL